MELTETLSVEGFDLAYAHEALARAHACEAVTLKPLTHRQLAVNAGVAIEGKRIAPIS